MDVYEVLFNNLLKRSFLSLRAKKICKFCLCFFSCLKMIKLNSKYVDEYKYSIYEYLSGLVHGGMEFKRFDLALLLQNAMSVFCPWRGANI